MKSTPLELHSGTNQKAKSILLKLHCVETRTFSFYKVRSLQRTAVNTSTARSLRHSAEENTSSSLVKSTTYLKAIATLLSLCLCIFRKIFLQSRKQKLWAISIFKQSTKKNFRRRKQCKQITLILTFCHIKQIYRLKVTKIIKTCTFHNPLQTNMISSTKITIA